MPLRHSLRRLTLSLAFAIAGPVLAQQLSDAPAPRPRIGLVLGGGGAKGAAHIGVLRVLDELHVPVDCVAGTSMGALVGATYAAGVPPAEIERMVRAVDWSATVGNAGRRDRMPISRKLEASPYTNNLDLGIRNGSLRTAGGFIETQRIEELLRNLVAGARYIDDFDSLPIPFRAVATDMMKGEMVVLGEGDLTVAMRASMAVPGAFSPVIIGDKVLADGGQMRNVPVDIARELCGDVIIAVSLASPPPKPEDLGSALALAGRSIDVMIEANGRAQLATLTEQDVSIVVPMGDIGSASFERVPDAIPLGREAALAKAPELSRYALPPEQYAAWRAGIDRDYTKAFRVAGVTIAGTKRVNLEYVRSAIKATVPGAEVTPDQIAADTTRIYSLGDFETVGYHIVSEPQYPTVEFTAIEKSWGPDFVSFDLGLGATNGGDFAFLIRGDYTRTWVNSLGGEWRSTLQLGQDALLGTRLYQPLEVSQRFFVEPSLRFNRNSEDVYIDGEREATFTFYESYGQVDLGANIGTRAQLRAGVRMGWDKADLYTGSPEVFPEVSTVQESDLVLRAVYDTRDASGLPSRGSLFVGEYATSGSWMNGEASYDMLQAMALRVLPFRGDSVYLYGSFGSDLGSELPPYRLFRLGGIRSFPGLERQQLRGAGYWVTGAVYNHKLADIQQLFGQALYGGLRLTAGRMDDAIDGEDEVIYGLAANLGGRTPIGPFLLSLGATSNNFWQVQFSLGHPIREGTILDEIW